LIVEVDGDQHGHDHKVTYDEARTLALQHQGFRVLRFSNADVMQRIDSVLDTIFATLTDAPSITRRRGGTTPTPGPSPQGRGEQEPTHGRHL
jgi:very-short-patch-repair endonuclease